ncbi:MAG: hypothetical protein AUJ52_14905 [Elusimicrobia bacterium CG1_02_63_36]|nr:MAG: hypothetical protein AUJ52_14905 [Elusimicrobia bacterium CG1_02_63_36]PIP82860.1 MAG: hypothetical protein COR54_12645 [Elusimicrobia bacterium CG22_combo_CG10-13_8_21_14_all_63_91]PJA18686.1 MAG: hypothetical protein COX66_00265 [Elusimicrobia bacterium CG_4_10_14_0_2_um_filter_63_34]PJB24059.1 MAG: hypothetical protein CO113_15870 [Elusimicrobia bacterium CG_4_9_14_3_um_filter_62_55]
MHLEWKNKVRQDLCRTCNTEKFAEKYLKLGSRTPALNPYPNIEVLLGMLRSDEARLYEKKDAALHALIAAAQGLEPGRFCATNLLLLGMWPGLDHLFYKLARLENHLPDLFAEIYWSFLEEIASFRLAKRDKIAANLRWNTEGRVRKVVRCEARRSELDRAVGFIESDLDRIMPQKPHHRGFEIRRITDAIPPRDLRRCAKRAFESSRRNELSAPEAELLARKLRELSKRGLLTAAEAELLIEHGLKGKQFAEIGESAGATAGAMRVRYHRAKAKVRPFLESSGRL